MQLILHAGVHRTGTTSIQKALERNRAALSERGVFYPESQGGRHREILRNLIKSGDADGVMADLKASAPAGTTTIVLSNEDFCRQTDLSWLSSALRIFDVKVFLYLLRQDYWMMSWYNQNIKSAWNPDISILTPEEFLDRLEMFHWLDYAQLANLWADYIGNENLYFRVLERDQVTDTTGDFFANIVSDLGGVDLSRSNFNVSLPTPVLEVKRRLNMLEIPAAKRGEITDAMIEAARPYGRVKPIYSPQTRNTMVARFAEPNAHVARTFFGRDDGQLFLEGPVPDDAPFEESGLPHASEDLWAIVAPLLRKMLA